MCIYVYKYKINIKSNIVLIAKGILLQLTWADLNLLILTNMIRGAGGLEVVEKFPKIHALQKRVESLPRIAEWLAK